MFEKVSRSLKYDSNIFFVHKHIYIYIWTPQPITLPRSRCVCGVIIIEYLLLWKQAVQQNDTCSLVDWARKVFISAISLSHYKQERDKLKMEVGIMGGGKPPSLWNPSYCGHIPQSTLFIVLVFFSSSVLPSTVLSVLSSESSPEYGVPPHQGLPDHTSESAPSRIIPNLRTSANKVSSCQQVILV